MVDFKSDGIDKSYLTKNGKAKILRFNEKWKDAEWAKKLSSKFYNQNCQSKANDYKQAQIGRQPNFFLFIFYAF